MNFKHIPLLNTETIDQIKSFSTDNSMIVELFTSFIDDSDILVKKIHSHTKNLDEDLQSQVHTLKGVAGTIGASRLHEICKLFDNNLRQGNNDLNIELADKLEDCYSELKSYIINTYLH